MAEASVGIAKVDAQHAELVAKIGELLSATTEAPRERLLALLEQLQACVLEHFATEEQLMAGHGYPEFANHRARHEHFVATFLRLKEQVATAARSPGELKAALEHQVAGWLHAHITSCDVPMGRFLAASGVN